MNRALVVHIVAIILSMLVAAHVNSYNGVTPANTQVVLAKTAGSVKSSNQSPTLGECLGMIGKSITLTFVAACLTFFPHVFKSVGGTLYASDSHGGVDGLGGNKK